MNRDEPLPHDVAALLRHERTIPQPPAGAYARVQTRLQATLAVDAPAVPRATGIGSMATKLIVATVLGAFGVTAVYLVTRGDATPHPDRVAPAPTAPAVVTPPPAALPAPQPDLPHASVPSQAQLPTSVPKPQPRKPEERELLDEALHCLAQQTPACALAAVAKHEHYYPNGALTEERDALRVQALDRSGDVASAREHARSFLQRYPNSIHATAIRHVLDE